LYKGKETDDMIYSFLTSVGINRKDCFIDRTYDSKTGELTISLVPLKRITFKWREQCKDKERIEKQGKKIDIISSKPVTKEMRDASASAMLAKEILVVKEQGEKIHIHTSKRYPDKEIIDTVKES
jgi:hypothetical protein